MLRARGRVNLAQLPDTPGEPYWTSSAYAGDPRLAWFVDFRSGYTFGYDRVDPVPRSLRKVA